MELLAPAADPEVFRAVVDAGADAVYFGGTAFGARTGAASFDPAAAAEAVSYAHLRGVKTYLTVNTLVKNQEMEEALWPFLRDYYNAGVDGVIVQDLGVLSMLRTCFPDWHVSASTQMTVASAAGARWLKRQGVARVVAPRELSLTEMERIVSETGIELEVFVHGALCVCYSGQCLMSSMIGGRSGNRGRCAQPCRLPYDVYAGGKRLDSPGPYVLSLKDLCGIKDLPALRQAGVASLKIEGRLKGAAYAAGVTAAYRRVLDAMYRGEPVDALAAEEEKKLLLLGSRGGFTDAYYSRQNGKDMVTFSDPAHHHDIPPVSEPAETTKIPVSLQFSATPQQPMRLLASAKGQSILSTGDLCEPSVDHPASEAQVRAQLQKTGQTPFAVSDMDIRLDGNVFFPVRSLNALRRDALLRLEEELVRPKRSQPLPWQPPKPVESRSNPSLPASMASRPYSLLLTCETKEQAETCLTWCSQSKKYDGRIALGISLSLCHKLTDPEWIQIKDTIHAINGTLLIRLPQVLRERACTLAADVLSRIQTDADGVLCGSVDGLMLAEDAGLSPNQVWLDASIYGWSQQTIFWLRQMGYQRMTLPLEQNRTELHAICGPESILTVYGRAPMMVMANCIHKDLEGCDHKPVLRELKDRMGNRFPVVNDCMLCMNTIYNCLPTYLGAEKEDPALAQAWKRCDFTIETAAEVKTVLTALENRQELGQTKTTKGHYRRGVL